jgi:2-polyprenyl-3-methyl-5-hydroxy-6-metoxy-1,4-benzoquinol methylase
MSQPLQTETEFFKPIAVTDPQRSPLAFRLRCLLDLQVATVARFLRPAMQDLKGQVLDVGAGESPWRSSLPSDVTYRGLDIKTAETFGMGANVADVDYYDGEIFPYDDNSFDGVLCIEVLEHTPNPALLLHEIARVLRPNGRLLLTVPWSARRHHVPYDFHRFTRERLQQLIAKAGFVEIQISERGSDISSIANKLIVRTMHLLKPRLHVAYLMTAILGLMLLPVTAAFLAAANIAIYRNWGSPNDPLGYFVSAVRNTESTSHETA